MALIGLFSVVAIPEDIPNTDLLRGQVGTVVETLEPGVFEVEFSGDNGEMYATRALRADQLVRLHYEPATRQLEATRDSLA